MRKRKNPRRGASAAGASTAGTETCIANSSGVCRTPEEAERARGSRRQSAPIPPPTNPRPLPEPPPISDEDIILANPIILLAKSESDRQQLISYFRGEYVREYRLSRCIKPVRSEYSQPENHQRKVESVCLERPRDGPGGRSQQAPVIAEISVVVIPNPRLPIDS